MAQISNMATDDAELLARMSAGDRHAFNVLYEKYWKTVFNQAYKRLEDMEKAEDIAQDIFEQLWIRGTKSAIANLPAYLFIATRNGVFKSLEKEKKYTDLPDFVYEMEGDSTRADSSMLYKEFVIAFDKLIEALPPQRRTIFKMRFNDNLSSRQIAEMLDLSPKTVRNQISKALLTLKGDLLLLLVISLLQKSK
jgi:RNA polymerase sigma-70 factor (family 1)